MLTAQHIREIRKALGLNLTQFAVMFDVTENAVRRWEMGDRHPRWKIMERLNEIRNELIGKGVALSA